MRRNCSCGWEERCSLGTDRGFCRGSSDNLTPDAKSLRASSVLALASVRVRVRSRSELVRSMMGGLPVVNSASFSNNTCSVLEGVRWWFWRAEWTRRCVAWIVDSGLMLMMLVPRMSWLCADFCSCSGEAVLETTTMWTLECFRRLSRGLSSSLGKWSR